MAVKLTKSQAVRDRQTGKVTIQHDYIKSHSTPDLIERYNSSNLKPKVKQKVKNELVRRGGVVFKWANRQNIEERPMGWVTIEKVYKEKNAIVGL